MKEQEEARQRGAGWQLTPWATHLVQIAPGRWESRYVVEPTNHAVKVRTQCLMREAEEAALANDEGADEAEAQQW